MMHISDLIVTIEWRAACRCGAAAEPRVEIVEGTGEGTATGVRFQVDYHARACVACGTPHRMAIVMPQEDRQ